MAKKKVVQRKKTFEGKKKKKKTIGKKIKKEIEKEVKEKFRYLREVDRLSYKERLSKHFGRTKVEAELFKATNRKQEDQALMRLHKQMEIEIKDQDMELEEYLQTIDAEFRKVGRPKSVLNWREFDYLCSIGCTLNEIAGFFQISSRSLEDRIKEEFGETFSQRWEKLSQGVKISIRRKQIAVALEGSESMLRFLGKNMLGQRDKLEFDGEVKVNSWVDLVNNIEDDLGENDAIPVEFDEVTNDNE